MKFENTWTGNWENAMRGLRHPMESYHKADTMWYEDTTENEYLCCNQALDIDSYNGKFLGIGPNDMDLAQRMIKAGTPNDKFLRQIFVCVDITAPLYWWKEMDTYKVATVANSTSTMHKLASTPITLECFEMDDFVNIPCHNWHTDEDRGLIDAWKDYIQTMENMRQLYLETKDIRYWKELIRVLPESWLQTRTWSANYSILRNIIHWRQNHKLSEWSQFIDWCKTLPYSHEFLFYENKFDK